MGTTRQSSRQGASSSAQTQDPFNVNVTDVRPGDVAVIE
jgi:hypothetical protein